MGFLDWLFGKKPLPKTDVSSEVNPPIVMETVKGPSLEQEKSIIPTNQGKFTEIGNTEPVCPYCNYRFDKMPQRKKKCPNCNNFVRSRTRPFDNKKVLVKEEQVDELEQQWNINNVRSDGIILGASPEVRQQQSQKLASQIEKNTNNFKAISPESTKQIRNIISEGARTGKNVREISREIVRQVEGIDIERAITMINTETMKAVNSDLRDRYAKAGIKKLERLVSLDENTCDKCAAIDGKIFTIEQAAAIDAKAHEGCRCTWIVSID